MSVPAAAETRAKQHRVVDTCTWAVAVPGVPRAKPGHAVANTVVLALVVALLDLEQPGIRGKVRRPMDERRIA